MLFSCHHTVFHVVSAAKLESMRMAAGLIVTMFNKMLIGRYLPPSHRVSG